MLHAISMPLAAKTPRLPDQITIDHGPRDLLGRFFLEADLAARSRCVYLHLHADLAGLMEVNRRATAWGTLVPIFHPEHSILKLDAAFWIEGRTAAGQTVATQAARFFLWPETTLAEEFASLRPFYADPEPRRAAGEKCIVKAPSAHRISGRVAFSGGAWYHPEFRGLGLSRILPRISRAYAHTRWQTDFTFSMVAPELVAKGVTKSYGYTRVEKEFELRESFRGDTTLDLVWMPADELLGDLAAYLASPSEDRVRNSEAPETKRVPSAAFQGRTRRS